MTQIFQPYRSRYFRGTKNLVVFDIDGVLFNSEHRHKMYEDGLKSGDHSLYFNMAEFDTAIPQGIHLAMTFVENMHFHTIFVTGRGDHVEHRATTLKMLRWHVSAYIADEQLLMREYPLPKNYEHDTVKKPKMIEAAGYDLSDIFMVFEDRNSIVDMWRARGVVAYHTQPGDF